MDGPSTPFLDVAEAPQRFPDFDYCKTYAQLLERSKFVLCPRGFGASSIRVFETMSYGRVPVIISMHGSALLTFHGKNFGCDPERKVSSLPVMLGKLEGKARPMGQMARQMFDANFSPGIFLDRLVSTLVSKYADLPVTPEQSAGGHGVLPDGGRF